MRRRTSLSVWQQGEGQRWARTDSAQNGGPADVVARQSCGRGKGRGRGGIGTKDPDPAQVWSRVWPLGSDVSVPGPRRRSTRTALSHGKATPRLGSGRGIGANSVNGVRET